MSLLIKGMDMPCAEGGFVFDHNYGNSKCAVITGDNKPLKWCDIIEIPTPHGRLIDADRLIAVLKSTTAISQSDYDLFIHIVGLIEHQPTVIEKEDTK